ncbi:hypothetical protein C7M84_009486 [Penaeus vannamei]|uniref:N-acetyltransferase domain-containing protein n=1 Tax=Penaeus vannamei TaxID=6689 RepID=A0A3R7M3U7_PENVA|nr:hypothetical protein C7M84_009486 [Penaeus vannamei]
MKTDINFFLKEDDFEEVVSFLAEDYFQREPITLGTGANEECQPGKGRMGEDVRRCLQSGLSVGARDRKTGQLIGLRVSNLLDRQKPFKSTQPRNEFEEVYRIAEHVVNHVFEEEADKFLMMFLLSVHKDYGARGIAGRMIKMSMEAGAQPRALNSLTLGNQPTWLLGEGLRETGLQEGLHAGVREARTRL